MKEYIEKEYDVEFSGYVRGTKRVKVYYDKDTKEKVDWDVVGDFDIIRDDTEYYEIPKLEE